MHNSQVSILTLDSHIVTNHQQHESNQLNNPNTKQSTIITQFSETLTNLERDVRVPNAPD